MESDHKLTGKEKSSLIFRYMKHCWGWFVATLIFSCLATALYALLPQIIKLTVDSILGGLEPELPDFALRLLRWDALRDSPRQALWMAAGAVVVLSLLRGLANYGQRTTLAHGSESYVKAIRDDLYHHIQHLTFAWHKANPTGDIIQRCTSDVDVIRGFVCNQLVMVIRTSFLIALYLTIMFLMNVRMALVALIFLPVVCLSSGVFYRSISRHFKEADEAEGELTTVAQENLTGVRVVRAFGRERFEEEKFKAKNERFSALWIRLGKLLSVYWASGTFITCLQVMTVILVGAVEAVNGRMTLGGFLIFATYNESLAWPVRSLGRVLSEMSKTGVSLDRVGYILNTPEETDAETSLPAEPGDIVFDHVTFGYEEQPVLKDVSFTIHKGETFAILGGTGSGKSTLVHLIDRLYDVPEGSGRITVGGTDVRQLRRSDLRRMVGVVLQEPFLFSRTIAENLRSADPDASEEELRRAAAVACVDEAISAFPDGYDTVVGERGVTLSGGQKQRVAIARMLLQKAPILIFDDSLSAVDAETDTKIRTALRETLTDSTVIMVSHRISTLLQADRILVLDEGIVSVLGTHAELIARPGIYRDIYEIQMRSDDRAAVTEGGNTDGQ